MGDDACADYRAYLYGDVLGVWRGWADDLRGHGLACGHHMAEEAPVALADALERFLDAAAASQRATRIGQWEWVSAR